MDAAGLSGGPACRPPCPPRGPRRPWSASCLGNQSFESERFAKVVELVITAMDISICFADFPTQKIGE
ncbi:hypothetical protein DLE01_09560, partial [Streptomyces sp. FT05W]